MDRVRELASLNFHHLLYFWSVVREGTIASAGQRLHVAQPTISAQLRTLEAALGERLFSRHGRNLTLTDTGRVVYRYADEIFLLGRELLDTLAGQPLRGPARVRVGVVDALPKMAVRRMLAPLLNAPEPIRVICFEGKAPELLGRLVLHELDVVLSDRPSAPDVPVRVYDQLLAESPVGWFAARREAAALAQYFPASLNGAPLLLPTANTALRRDLDTWLQQRSLRPQVVAEFEDSALLKAFGESGFGIFPAPLMILDDIQRQYQVELIGAAHGVVERFYATHAERRTEHPGVRALLASTPPRREDEERPTT